MILEFLPLISMEVRLGPMRSSLMTMKHFVFVLRILLSFRFAFFDKKVVFKFQLVPSFSLSGFSGELQQLECGGTQHLVPVQLGFTLWASSFVSC